MKFINLYDDNYVDTIVQAATIESITKCVSFDKENTQIRVKFVGGNLLMLEYDDEDNRDDAFEDFVDDLCEEGGF